MQLPPLPPALPPPPPPLPLPPQVPQLFAQLLDIQLRFLEHSPFLLHSLHCPSLECLFLHPLPTPEEVQVPQLLAQLLDIQARFYDHQNQAGGIVRVITANVKKSAAAWRSANQ